MFPSSANRFADHCIQIITQSDIDTGDHLRKRTVLFTTTHAPKFSSIIKSCQII